MRYISTIWSQNGREISFDVMSLDFVLAKVVPADMKIKMDLIGLLILVANHWFLKLAFSKIYVSARLVNKLQTDIWYLQILLDG